MSDDLKLLLLLVVPLVSIVTAYAALRHAISLLASRVEELATKNTKMEATDASRDNKVTALESAHTELKQRHGEGMAELRGRTASIEALTSNLERAVSDIKGDLRLVTASAARLEARQDSSIATLDSLRRDVLMGLGAARRAKDGGE